MKYLYIGGQKPPWLRATKHDVKREGQRSLLPKMKRLRNLWLLAGRGAHDGLLHRRQRRLRDVDPRKDLNAHERLRDPALVTGAAAITRRPQLQPLQVAAELQQPWFEALVRPPEGLHGDTLEQRENLKIECVELRVARGPLPHFRKAGKCAGRQRRDRRGIPAALARVPTRAAPASCQLWVAGSGSGGGSLPGSLGARAERPLAGVLGVPTPMALAMCGLHSLVNVSELLVQRLGPGTHVATPLLRLQRRGLRAAVVLEDAT
mmetsp:Transcript_18474/g.57892  ORF Transcript_18474/g.57892 Transcript_18474/m.57892 type:complete len:263 (+) Transcript_18474:234-1022(+)